ncbi:response regulator transcription factor [Bacillus sp. CGMCC 1.16607]|uniref:response regulator transcription factor n=1 Tax=Bacillus sp. CGMCC 1.16607 TaxID=3351842 RepID=UPI0036277FFD
MTSILVIEDDQTLAFGVKYALERENWSVSVVTSLKEATDFLENHTPELIILDNQLPDGYGLDFCGKIRLAYNIPIIFLTAADDEIDIVRGLDAGADDYVTKPFRVMELISRIKSVLRRSVKATPLQNQRLKSKDIIILLDQQRVEKRGIEINLSYTEFKLLLTFMQHPDQVLTREILLEKLWDMDSQFIENNTLSVHIRRLREKLEDDPSLPKYIVTIRGTGYKWYEGEPSS